MRFQLSRTTKYLLTTFIALCSWAGVFADFELVSEEQVFSANERLVLKTIDFDKRSEPIVATFSANEKGAIAESISSPTGIYKLIRSDRSVIDLAPSNSEKLEIVRTPSGLQVKDSPNSRLLVEYENFRKQSLERHLSPARANTRAAKARNASESEVVELIHKEVLAFNEHTKELNDFSIDQVGASISLYATSLRWNSEHRIDELSQVVNSLLETHSDNAMVKSMRDKIDRIKATTIGSTAPEISGKDLSGETLSLSSTRGKYVLLEFWASWCSPCRIENQHFHELKKTYSNNEFEIFAVNLDKREVDWRRASQQDRISWLQISDLSGWESPLAQTYNVSALPANLLIDPEGKILAKNIGGAALEKRLAELLGK